MRGVRASVTAMRMWSVACLALLAGGGTAWGQTQPCVPTPDRQRCEPVTCPIPNEKCAPRCVQFHPVTGAYSVLECDCRLSAECQVAPPGTGTTSPCVEPDNGTGTADFPPVHCAHETPDGNMLIRDGLHPPDTIDIEAMMTNMVVLSRNPGGSLGGEIQIETEMLMMDLRGTGGLLGFNRFIPMQTNSETHTAPRMPGDPVQSFDTDMFMLQGQLPPGDPDFDLLRVTAGTGFGMPSPGHTTLVRQPGGGWAVDSFFDITYRIDFIGAPGGRLGGMSGSTTATIRMQAGLKAPRCSGSCSLPGEICDRTVTAQTDGSVIICCDCRVQNQDCRPKLNGSACEPVVCPIPGEDCVPVAARFNPATGQAVVTACDCRSPNECHAEVVPGTVPYCVGVCPDPTQICEQVITTNPDGTIDIRCECKPHEQVCQPKLDGSACEPVVCPLPNEICVPVAGGYDATGKFVVTECDCRSPEECHVEIIPPATASCVGVCPDPTQICETITIINPDGTPGIRCECRPHEQVCQPKLDGSACEPVTCPIPGQECVPVAIAYNPATGQAVVTQCDCKPIEECHPEVLPGALPFCTGVCPDPRQVCDQVLTPLPDGTLEIRCRCTCTDASCDDGDPCTDDHCDPLTGQCVHTPKNCDDGNPCTTDHCDPATDPAQCKHDPIDCDDHDPCTDDRCDPLTGQCLHTPKNCDDGDPCTEDYCDPAAGGCVHTPIPGCGSVPKFSQLPTPDREDIASNLWVSPNGLQLPNVVVADDFRSDGRPITRVKWWGSYLNQEYVPPQFGGFGQPPYMIDGWLISFHRPLRPVTGGPQRAPIGLYFAPAEAVRIVATTIQPCDGHPVFEYLVDLSQCCLVHSFPDPRVPAGHACSCPAQPEAFYECRCFRYHLDIQAVVGVRWQRMATTACCERVYTNNVGLGNFWGWHTTDVERDRQPALRSTVSLGPVVTTPCPPLNQCPPMQQLRYGPWSLAQPVCPFPHRINMAFELLTSTLVTPLPCPRLILVSAVSVKTHPTSPPKEFGIDLPLDPPSAAGVECRKGGPTEVRLTFSEDVMADDESLDIGDEVSATGATITSLAIAGNVLTVRMTGAANASCVRLVVENGPDGITTLGSDPLDGDNDVHIRVLLADVTGNGVVNIEDLQGIKGSLFQALSSSNFRRDVNVDGVISIVDLSDTKAKLFTAASCP